MSPLGDELARALVQQAGLEAAQAAQAVDVLLRLLAARLPSPLFGELQARLAGPAASPAADPAGGPAPSSSSSSSAPGPVAL